MKKPSLKDIKVHRVGIEDAGNGQIIHYISILGPRHFGYAVFVPYPQPEQLLSNQNQSKDATGNKATIPPKSK